mmetsp:Transcript_109226/g.308075  ORF Transcript_109226/g.308075 Transcript_109226/m.308075 type:complete len:241 (+) Transcript_109226:1063-1785(+)
MAPNLAHEQHQQLCRGDDDGVQDQQGGAEVGPIRPHVSHQRQGALGDGRRRSLVVQRQIDVDPQDVDRHVEAHQYLAEASHEQQVAGGQQGEQPEWRAVVLRRHPCSWPQGMADDIEQGAKPDGARDGAQSDQECFVDSLRGVAAQRHRGGEARQIGSGCFAPVRHFGDGAGRLVDGPGDATDLARPRSNRVVRVASDLNRYVGDRFGDVAHDIGHGTRRRGNIACSLQHLLSHAAGVLP